MPEDTTFKTHPQVLELCSMILDMTGAIPDPREVLALDLDYVSDLFKWRECIKFHEDMHKRPNYLQPKQVKIEYP